MIWHTGNAPPCTRGVLRTQYLDNLSMFTAAHCVLRNSPHLCAPSNPNTGCVKVPGAVRCEMSKVQRQLSCHTRCRNLLAILRHADVYVRAPRGVTSSQAWYVSLRNRDKSRRIRRALRCVAAERGSRKSNICYEYSEIAS